MEDPPRKFRRLSPGEEVRLRYGYIIKCKEVVKDDAGNVVELRCTYDPETRSGTSDRKVKGTIHWVSARHALRREVRLYDRLFSEENPQSFEDLNPDSLKIIENALIEPAVVDAQSAVR